MDLGALPPELPNLLDQLPSHLGALAHDLHPLRAMRPELRGGFALVFSSGFLALGASLGHPLADFLGALAHFRGPFTKPFGSRARLLCISRGCRGGKDQHGEDGGKASSEASGEHHGRLDYRAASKVYHGRYRTETE
jgi:hypothetical protein